VSVASEAWRAAHAAAAAARVEVAELSGPSVSIVGDIVEQVWGPGQAPHASLLLALAHAGNPLLVATRGGRPAGLALGFLGWSGGFHVHSHMTAVTDGERSGGVGYALKLWQRAVCVREGIDEVRWTYDPLMARNAHFNLVKLGAEVVAYRPDFYGAMDDTVNAGDRSDRFEVSWRLRSDRVLEAVAGRRPPVGHAVGSLEIPVDYDRLRRTEPDEAAATRLRVREALERAWSAGLGVEWSQGRYVFVDGGGTR
jgi:predicted GNAT superfamily acetyltransferase